ncbi:MAG: rhodanese-like domain-containing protein, partial [Pseudomonadota bacterium]
RTSDPDIYAGGDCVESRHLLTGRPVYVPLGTTANKHGRIIGDNLCGAQESFPGVLGTTLLKACDYTVGRSGLTSQAAVGLGHEIEEAVVPARDRAHYYGGAHAFALKMTAEREGGRILGVQMVGPGDVARRLDAAVAAMSFGATIKQMSQLDLGYAPPYASAMDLLIVAANVLRNKIEGGVPSATPLEVKAALASENPPLLLDVRSKPEWDKVRLQADGVLHLPYLQLRKTMDRLPRDREIVTFCWGGLRAYEAAIMLREAGFPKVRFLDGSLFTWPFDLDERETDWR